MHTDTPPEEHPPQGGLLTPAPTLRQSYLLAGGALLLLSLLSGAGLLLGGEVGRFVLAGLNIGQMPFILLALLGMLGLYHTWARWTSYIYALLLQGLVGLFTINQVLLGVLEGPPTAAELPLRPGGELVLLVMLLTLLLLFGLASAVLLRPVRQWLARWLPIDPGNHTHTLALWLLLFVTTSAYAQLALLGGEPPLLTAINTGVISSEDLGSRSELGQQLDLIYGLIWMLPLALVAAGWPVRRTAGETLQRLGLVRPTWRQLAFGIVAAVVLAVLMGYLSEGLTQLWRWLGWPETDAVAFEQLLSGLLNPFGAVVIGITAGLGEELAVRGVLQPRLGLLLSNLAFTAIHAYQYSFDALLIVFLLGTVLGILRHYTNTTTAAVVHGVYNTATILLSLP